MVTREEKNKKIQQEISREKSIERSKKTLKVIILLGFFLTAIYLNLHFIETKFIKTYEYRFKNSSIPNSFDGLKILHFSDLLYGSSINSKDLVKLQKEFNKIKPDIVVFTGDIVMPNYTLEKDELNDLKTFFKEIPYNITKYAVRGENDNSTFDLIMNEANFKVLDNKEDLVYYMENNPISFVGFNSNDINDVQTKDNIFKICLIHNYDYFKASDCPLVLAGHNLNGEIYIPFYKGILGNNKYNGKFYEENNQTIYISNGLGTLHNMRLFNHPSINVYRLSK